MVHFRGQWIVLYVAVNNKKNPQKISRSAVLSVHYRCDMEQSGSGCSQRTVGRSVDCIRLSLIIIKGENPRHLYNKVTTKAQLETNSNSAAVACVV